MSSEIKPICGLERVKLSDVVPLETPFTLFIFPTTYCNFKCNYCGHSLGLETMKEKYSFVPQSMTMEIFEQVVEQAKEFRDKFKLISLTGHGEPLLNKNLPKMIEMIKKLDIAERVEIISNASLLSNNMANDLIESGLDTLRISIQGLSNRKYKEVCSYELDFDELLSNIEYFYKNKKQCEVFVKIMDVSLDEDEETKFYDMFAKISDRMYVEKCRPVYDGVEYNEGAFVVADRYGRNHNKRYVCPLPFFMLGIFPNGDVEPCDTIYKPIVLGNVNNQTLFEMWTGEKLKEFRMIQLKKKRSCNSHCSVCFAPDDVSHPEDDLDSEADIILEHFISD